MSFSRITFILRHRPFGFLQFFCASTKRSRPFVRTKPTLRRQFPENSLRILLDFFTNYSGNSTERKGENTALKRKKSRSGQKEITLDVHIWPGWKSRVISLKHWVLSLVNLSFCRIWLLSASMKSIPSHIEWSFRFSQHRSHKWVAFLWRNISRKRTPCLCWLNLFLIQPLWIVHGNHPFWL